MGEITRSATDFPQPEQLVTAFQSYLRRTAHAPEYGAIGGTAYDRVVHGPHFTAFVLTQTCEIQGIAPQTDLIAERTSAIHERTKSIRFDSGRIVPELGRQVLGRYATQQMSDPHVEVARRLALGLGARDHESEVVARDTQIVLSRYALDGGFDELVVTELPDASGMQAPVPDVA